MAKRKWTDKEIEFLKENYTKLSKSELISVLGRTWNSIQCKARRLHLAHRKNEFRARAYKPRQVTCPVCGKMFVTTSTTRKYCSENCLYKYHNLKRKDERNQWLKLHPEKSCEWQRRYHARLNEMWYGKKEAPRPFHMDPLVIQSEIFVAQEVLPKLGFTNILLTRSFSNFFPCDILAKKDGRVCLIEVTLSPERKINPRISPLADFLNAKVFVCHVKPDFSTFFLKEVDVKKKLYSACSAEFREVVSHR